MVIFRGTSDVTFTHFNDTKCLIFSRKTNMMGRMLYDLGLDEKGDREAVKRKIKEVDKSFDLVMIVEKFPESLILMKNELCWSTSDITSLKLNGRIEEVKKNLNSSIQSLLKEFLEPEYLLYNHFANVFEKKITNFGKKRMNNELSDLSDANSYLLKTCSLTPSEKLLGDPRKSWGGKGLQGFEAGEGADDECIRMTLRARDYVEKIRKIQTEKVRQGYLDEKN